MLLLQRLFSSDIKLAYHKRPLLLMVHLPIPGEIGKGENEELAHVPIALGPKMSANLEDLSTHVRDLSCIILPFPEDLDEDR